MTYNHFNIRRLIGRALGIDRPNPQLWGLIVKESGGESGLRQNLAGERVTYLALPGLKHSSVISDITIKHIEKAKLGSLANNLYLIKVFEEVSDYLNREEIAHLRIKGLDLIRDFYADPSLRPISDIDILVKPTQFGEAVKLLFNYGFSVVQSGQRLPGVWPAVNLIRADGAKPVWIDLHYCLGPAVGDRVKSTLAMFNEVSIDEPLPPEYRAVVLAAHHQNHFMEMPIIAYYELLHLIGASNHDTLFKLARRWQVADALYSALNRASWIFGIPAQQTINEKNNILRYLTAKGLHEPRGGFSRLESLVYLLSLDNPGAAIPFGLELLYKKITSNL
jgi:hypothetical protein